MIKNSRGHGNRATRQRERDRDREKEKEKKKEIERERERSWAVLNYQGNDAGGIDEARKQFARNLAPTDIPEPRTDLVPGPVVGLAINRPLQPGVIPLDRLAARKKGVA